MNRSESDDRKVEQTRKGWNSGRWWLLVIAMVLVVIAGILRISRSFSRVSETGDTSMAIGSALIAVPLSVGLIFLVFVSVRWASVKRARLLKQEQPDALIIERLLYAAETDANLQKVGGTASIKPGFEYVSAAVSRAGIAIVKGSHTHVACISSEIIKEVGVEKVRMVNGRLQDALVVHVEQELEALRVPFFVIANKGVSIRSLNRDDLIALRDRVSEQLAR